MVYFTGETVIPYSNKHDNLAPENSFVNGSERQTLQNKSLHYHNCKGFLGVHNCRVILYVIRSSLRPKIKGLFTQT